MPGYQPRHDTDPVWFNGTQVNNLAVASAQTGVRITAVHGWDDRPDVRDVRALRSGQDGEYADNLYLGGRTLTIEGEVYGSTWTDLQARKRALAAIFQPASDEKLLKIPDPSATAWEELWSTEVEDLSPTAWWRLNDLASPPSSNSYDSTVLARADTVAYWELGEASGTTAVNSVSGGAYPGTIAGSPSMGVAGPLIGSSDKAIDFDGSNDEVTVTYNAALNPAAFTVGAWVMRDTDTGAIESIVSTRPSGLVGWRLAIDGTDKAALGIGNGAALISAQGTTSIPTGQWTYIEGTYDGTNARIYVNGVLEGTSASVTISQNGTGVTRIGSDVSGFFFNGKIAKVSLHNAALTASEIGSLFVKGRPVSDTQGSYAGGMIDAPTSATGAIAGDSDACFDFDGSNDGVVIPYTSALNAATFSIAGWVYRDVDTGGTEPIVNSRPSANTSGYQLSISGGDKLQLGLSEAAGFSNITGATSLATGAWYHVAATYDGTTSRVYLNGALDASGADAYVANTTAPFEIGKNFTPQYLNGKIDELMYYGSRVLTAAEIARLYDIGTFDHEVYETSGMYSYERSSCRVVESIQFGDTLDPCCQVFQVVLRASDPRIYSDVETSTDSGTTGTAARTVTVDQTGTFETPLTATVTGPTGSSWSVSDGSSVSISISNFTVASTESVALDTLARTATLSSPYSQIRIRDTALEAIWMLNETSGTTADNAEGTSALDGTYQNGVVLNQPGPSSGVAGVTLDGTNDYISVPYAAALSDSSFTFETWVRPTGAFGTIAADVDTGFTTGWWLTVGDAGNVNVAFFAASGKVTEARTPYGAAAASTWTHVAFVMSSTTAAPVVYINGAYAVDSALSLTGTWVPSSATGITLGRRANVTTPFYLNGRLGPTAFYSRAMSATEIADLYSKRLATSTASIYSYIEASSSRWDNLATTSTTFTLASDSLSTGSKLNVTYRDARL